MPLTRPRRCPSSWSGPAFDFCLLVTQRRHRDNLAVTAAGPDAEQWLTIAQAFAGPPVPVVPVRVAREPSLAHRELQRLLHVGVPAERLAREMVEGGPIDVLTGDYLAELTLMILFRECGAAVLVPATRQTFLRQMEEVLGTRT